jgi:hypothetical protein
MKVTIHQPEHFPYMGFFMKMKKSDLFVMLDDVKFRKNYFQNRNRFPTKSGAEEWFTVPVQKKFLNKNINEVLVSKDFRWRKKIIKQIEMNFKIDLSEIYEGDNLLEINKRSIDFCREKLGITTPIVYSSDLGVPGSKTEKLANICEAVKASEYISGPFGKEYLDLELFKQKNIEVCFFEPKVNNYYSCLYNLHIEGKL